MKRALWLVVLAAGGCELVFPVSTPMSGDPDAAGSPDKDGGGDDDAASHVDSQPICVGGANEDDDSVEDACDVCPHVPGAQTDSDTDGVGNDCDRHGSGGDTWVVFDGWNSFNQQQWFTEGAGAWATDGGRLVLLSNDSAHLHYQQAIEGLGSIATEMILPPGIPVEQQIAGLEIRHANTESIICAAINQRGGQASVAIYRYSETTGVGSPLTQAIAVARGVPFKIELGFEVDDVFCEVNGVPLVQTAPTPSGSTALGTTGYFFHDAAGFAAYTAIVSW